MPHNLMPDIHKLNHKLIYKKKKKLIAKELIIIF